MRTVSGTILAAAVALAAFAAHGAAMLECGGLVTEKSPGWRFEASDANGGQTFNLLEGWYPDKGGRLVSPRFAIPKAGAYYKLSFAGLAPARSYEAVAFYDAAGNMIADNYDVIYGGEVGVQSSSSRKDEKFHSPTPTQHSNFQSYERVVFAQEGVKEVEVFFQSTKGCTVHDVKFEPATAEEAAKWCDSVYAKLPPLEFAVPSGGQGTARPAMLPPKTLDALKTGKPWRILMLGDSIMQDTFHSQFHALVKRAYPKSDVTWLVSVRGSTGCWYYCEPENFKKYVADYKPDCVFIGGISGWIHPDMPLNGGPAIESVAKRVNGELGAEVVVMTPTLAVDWRVPKGTAQGSAVASSAFDHAALGEKTWKYDVAAAEELKAICAKNGWPLWNMFTPAYDWLFKTGLPSEFYSRDYVHSGELGKQLIARIALAYFTAANTQRMAPEPSFVLTLRRNPDDEGTLVAPSNAVASSVREVDGVMRYEWRFPEGCPVECASAEVRENGDESRYRFRAVVADGWHLEVRSFPRIPCPLVGADGKRRLFISGRGGWGGYGYGPTCYSSNGDAAGAFAATWDDEEGVYFGVEDASGRYHQVGFFDIAGVRLLSNEAVGWSSGEVSDDYDIVVRKVRRGAQPLVWSDFCDIYREWGDRQSWSGKPLAMRDDVPGWLKSGAAMTRFSRGWLEDPARLERHLKWWRRTFGGQPVLAAIWGWEKLGTWYSPDYFPCHPDDETFAKCIALMKKYGFHPFVWPSGLNWSETIGDLGGGRYRWDGRETWIKPNLSHLAAKRNGGHSRKAFWLENGSQVSLCGGDAWSHGWLAGVVRELAARGIEVVQIDQYGGGCMPECWNAAHGHEPGNGAWQLEASRRLLESVKSVKGVSAVCNEFRWERLNDLVVLQDIRDMETASEFVVDVFGYLHHGRVVPFQSNPRRHDIWQLAHMVAEGQMPFFEPQFENSLPVRPALKNGGFEEVTDNARGPECWDRRPFNGNYLKGVDWTKPAWGVRGWSHSGWLGTATVYEKKDVHSGSRAILVDHREKNWIDGVNPIQIAQTVEGLEPGRYTVACWVKSESDLAELKLGGESGELASMKLPSSGEWTRIELSAEAKGELTILFFAKLGAKFLLDDVKLTRDGAEVVQSGDTRWIDFHRRWFSLYCGEASKFLARGRRIRAPEVKCARIRLGGDCGREVEAVCCAAYRADDGEEAFVLANGTWSEQPVELERDGKRESIVVAPGAVKMVYLKKSLETR